MHKHTHTPKLYTVFGIHTQYNRNCLSLLLLFLRRSKGRGTGKGLLKGCVTFWLKLQWKNWRFLRILKSVSSFAIMWCNVFSGGETINNNTHTHTLSGEIIRNTILIAKVHVSQTCSKILKLCHSFARKMEVILKFYSII